MKLTYFRGWILALAAAFAPAVSSCGENKTVSAHITDSTITATVKSKLIADEDVKARNIDVNTENGVVYLLGTVHSEAEKAEAARLATGCEGVKQVVNHVQVGGGENKSVSGHITDATISAAVTTKLIEDEDTKARNIDVNTENGVVYLLGTVNSEAEKAEAGRLTASCEGVKQVVNDLQIGP